MDKKIVTTALLPIIGTVVITGAVLLNTPKTKQCYIRVDEVSQENLVPKLIEQLNAYKVSEKEVIEVGCKLTEVYATTDVFNREPLKRLSDEGCVKKTAEEFNKMREDTARKLLEYDKLDPIEAKEVKQDFADLWNYILFRKCGIK